MTGVVEVPIAIFQQIKADRPLEDIVAKHTSQLPKKQSLLFSASNQFSSIPKVTLNRSTGLICIWYYGFLIASSWEVREHKGRTGNLRPHNGHFLGVYIQSIGYIHCILYSGHQPQAARGLKFSSLFSNGCHKSALLRLRNAAFVTLCRHADYLINLITKVSFSLLVIVSPVYQKLQGRLIFLRTSTANQKFFLSLFSSLRISFYPCHQMMLPCLCTLLLRRTLVDPKHQNWRCWQLEGKGTPGLGTP